MINKLLRNIPSVHELQNDNMFFHLNAKYDIDEVVLTAGIREVLERIRSEIKTGDWKETAVVPYIWDMVDYHIDSKRQFNLIRVINATGTILHTNLGRARLSSDAINRVVEVANNYSNLEYDIESGERGSRHNIVESLITEVTGAEAAMVVNNNAAAVYLVLTALAKHKEVIVSRGQLVEIGGSFRISSIMEESGAKLVEVGTTNKTHLKDYEAAITDETAMLLKVHTSNFKTIGFTKTVSTEDLVELKNNREDLIVFEDLGSGVLYDYRQHGIGDEPVVQQVLASGIDLVSFSGDKLLGGPQAGIIVGKKKYIDVLKKHQLARVLRVDKMCFAALEATFQAYRNRKEKNIPAVRDMLLTPKEIKEKAGNFLSGLENASSFQLELKEDISMVGGGTMPDVFLPTFVVKLKHNTFSAHLISERLRKGSPCIIVRTKDQHILLDFRTITQEEIPLITDAFQLIHATCHD